ncbi:hypothetical protein DAPPUDRAFT_276167, partial [Daphnia pulex]
MGKAWLSFGRSRRVKSRNKPRRWPSTPAFLPTSSRASAAAAVTLGGSSGDLVESSSASPQAPQPLPTSLSATNGHGGSSHNLTTAKAQAAAAAAIRPQPYIQGYHLTLPSFLSNRSRHQQQQQQSGSSFNQSQPKNRQLLQLRAVFYMIKPRESEISIPLGPAPP